MGTACASAIVKTVGPDVNIDKHELHERAEDVRERIKRV
jgi:hypothetical protein